MRKKSLIVVLATGLFLSNAFNSFAAWEQSEQGWRYKGDLTGEYFTECAEWIDGNSDGIYERYHFDAAGYLVTNNGDGYEINSDGMELMDGCPRTINLSQLKETMNNSFFRKEYLNLLGCDKATVDKALGAPSKASASSYIYNAPDGSEIYAMYNACGRLESFTGNAEVFCVFTKDSYTFDELDTITGNKRGSDLLPMWYLSSGEPSLTFLNTGINAMRKNDNVSFSLLFP